MSGDLSRSLVDAADGPIAVVPCPVASERVPLLAPTWGQGLTELIFAAVEESDE